MQACNPDMESLVYDLIQPSKTSSDPESWTMFKVPHQLRQVNNKAYEPRLISIGPYYHGNEHLKMMEIMKKSCFRRIIGESMDEAKKFVSAMKDMEEDVRKCYPQAFGHISSNAFVKMMILDGCFIVDLFRTDCKRECFLELNGKLTEIHYDLLLLENQLPFYLLSKLYGMIKRSNVEKDEFPRLALVRLKKLIPGLFSSPEKFPEDIKHLLGLVHDSLIPQDKGVQEPLSNFIGCATELDNAGIKFVKKHKEGAATMLFDVEFTKAKAKLKIPTLMIDENAELLLRNLMGYEQFIPKDKPTYVCDYVVFMDNLINTGMVVQLLRDSDVIVNWLSDDEAVSQMFNKLREFTYNANGSFFYKEMYDDVNNHCRSTWNKSKARLKKDYFNTPWSIISFSAAVFLLLLTVLQSVFSVLSYVDQ